MGERSALLCTSTFSTPNLLGTFTGPLQPLILPHLRQENADLTSKHGRRRDVFKLQYQVQDRRAKRAPVRLLRQSCTWMRCCRVLPLQEWAVWWREVWHSAGLSYMEIRDHSSTTMTMPLPTKKITSGTNDPANIPTDASKNLNALQISQSRNINRAVGWVNAKEGLSEWVPEKKRRPSASFCKSTRTCSETGSTSTSTRAVLWKPKLKHPTLDTPIH